MEIRHCLSLGSMVPIVFLPPPLRYPLSLRYRGYVVYVLVGHLMISGFYYLSSSGTMSVCWGKKRSFSDKGESPTSL